MNDSFSVMNSLYMTHEIKQIPTMGMCIDSLLPLCSSRIDESVFYGGIHTNYKKVVKVVKVKMTPGWVLSTSPK